VSIIINYDFDLSVFIIPKSGVKIKKQQIPRAEQSRLKTDAGKAGHFSGQPK
jgi:hypothetical protein